MSLATLTIPVICKVMPIKVITCKRASRERPMLKFAGRRNVQDPPSVHPDSSKFEPCVILARATNFSWITVITTQSMTTKTRKHYPIWRTKQLLRVLPRRTKKRRVGMKKRIVGMKRRTVGMKMTRVG